MKIIILAIAIMAISSCDQPWFPFSERIERYPKPEGDNAEVTISIEWPEEE